MTWTKLAHSNYITIYCNSDVSSSRSNVVFNMPVQTFKSKTPTENLIQNDHRANKNIYLGKFNFSSWQASERSTLQRRIWP